eukprot:sb/3474340/
MTTPVRRTKLDPASSPNIQMSDLSSIRIASPYSTRDTLLLSEGNSRPSSSCGGERHQLTLDNAMDYTLSTQNKSKVTNKQIYVTWCHMVEGGGGIIVVGGIVQYGQDRDGNKAGSDRGFSPSGEQQINDSPTRPHQGN